MWGAAEWALRAATSRHFSTTTTTSGRRGGWTAMSVGASTAAPYSMHPSSAWTAGTLALNTSRNCARVPGARVTVART